MLGDCSLICMNKNVVFSICTSAASCSLGPELKLSSHCRDLDASFVFTVMQFRYSNLLSGSDTLALWTHEQINLFILYFSFLFRKVSDLLLVLIDVASLIKLILFNCEMFWSSSTNDNIFYYWSLMEIEIKYSPFLFFSSLCVFCIIVI